MIVETKHIEYEYGDTITLKPFGDVHLGARACDIRAFKKYLSNSDDKTYFMCIGDYYDAIVVQDRRYQKSTDATIGDAIIDQQIEQGINLLEPYKDRLLGMALGNHENVVIKRAGTDMIARTCDALNVPHLGYSGLYRLVFREKNGRGRTVVIRYHHGWGGGSRTQGADLTKFSRDLVYWDADIFLFGHVHRKQTDEIPRLSLAGNKLLSKPMIVAICGTFLKTYIDGRMATYSEVKGYPPISVGGVMINIRPDKSWVHLEARLDSGYD